MPITEINSIYTPSIYGRKSFPLKHNDYSIFYKIFNAQDQNIVGISSDKIFIENHFFKTGEPLKYSPGIGSSIGISTNSYGANGIATSFSPIIYPIVIDKDNIRVALASSLALNNQYVNITSLGIGTQHSLEAFKQNSKCLVSVNNLIQSPVSIASTTLITDYTATSITTNSLQNISLGSLLKINEEIVKVSSIDYDNKILTISRGVTVLGTESIPFTNSLIGSSVHILSGAYNIIQDVIYFDEPPLEGKKESFTVLTSDINFNTDSFNIITDLLDTGYQVLLSWPNPPVELPSQGYYYLIKNNQNNYSFASTLYNALNGIKIGFNNISNNEFPVTEFRITFFYPSESGAFSGRVFLKSNYDSNQVFDDISEQFTGIASSFELKSSGISTAGISTDNGIVLINNIFQYPEFGESFYYREVGIGTTAKTYLDFVGFGTTGFTGKNYDVNVKGYPRGGIILSYGSSFGNNYQPLTAATGIANISGGSVSGVSIIHQGSGYRSGISTYYVRIIGSDSGITPALGIANIGFGSVTSVTMIDGGSGFGSTTYYATFDDPIPYENIPLSGSSAGIGASISFDISAEGNVQNLIFKNFGYSYKVGETLSPIGIVTSANWTPSDTLSIQVNDVTKDSFSAWNIGILQKLDDLSPYVNGTRKTFTLMETFNNVSQRLNLDSDSQYEIELQQNLLVFVNDILQVPGLSYTFNKGSKITFSEPIPYGSNVKVYFYKGYYNDVINASALSKIKEGDNLQLNQNIYGSPPIQQNQRTILEIINSDTLRTDVYSDIGLSDSSSQLRSVTWTPQKTDLILNGVIITKSRFEQRSGITSFTKLSEYVGIFTGISTSVIGVATNGIQIGDYVEGDYVGTGVTVVSIGSSIIGIGYSSTNTGIGDTSLLSFYRKS
jgi:hypothetical protein